MFPICVSADNLVHKRSHIACIAAHCAIDVIAARADRVGAVVILVGEVKIPHRTGKDGIVMAELVEVHRPIRVGIATYLTYQKMPEEGLAVQVRVGGLLYGVEDGADGIHLCHRDAIRIRVMDGNGGISVRPKPSFLVPGISVCFDEKTALIHVNAVLLDLYLVAELVAPLVITVHHHIHRADKGSVWQLKSAREVEC